MQKSDKIVLRRTRLTFMGIITLVLSVFLVASFFLVNYYYGQRRILGGMIEINQKLPEMVKNNFEDTDYSGMQTQNEMFVISLDGNGDIIFNWKRKNYEEFKTENPSYTFGKNETKAVGSYLISSQDVNGTRYYVGFYQGISLINDKQMIKTTFITISWIFFGLLVLLYISSFILLRPLKINMEMQNNFIANASHDMKTPLAIMRANVDLLKEKGIDNNEIENIETEISELNTMVKDMLLLDKMHSSMYIDWKNVKNENISNLTNDVLYSFDSECYMKGISFQCDIKENLYLKVIASDYKTLITQLTMNAVKYVNDEKIIKVRLYENEDEDIEFSIYNTQSVVDESEEKQIFERFYRSVDATNSQISGNGIGLSVVKAIANTYRYKIKVKINTKKDILFTVTLKNR